MKQPKTTLVLGAGASLACGFPTGMELRQELLSWLLPDMPPAMAQRLLVPARDLIAFLTEFKHAQTYSIDAFLARRPEFDLIGKRCIAGALLGRESESMLFNESRPDNWYQYLVNRLTVHDWESLDFSWLSVVTFNYDRSLEWFLCRALQSAYGKERAHVVEKLQSLRIVHVYGCLGVPWDDIHGIPYQPDQGILPGSVRVAAGNLRVIPEGRNEDATIREARQCMEGADSIYFLGFSFDGVNLERLGVPDIFRRPGGWRTVGGTRLGMTNAEMSRALRQMYPKELKSSDPWSPRFVECNCTAFLRGYLPIG